MSPTDPSTPSSNRLPPQIGRYLVERRLPGGAMGDVFVGVDPLIGRKVVLKTVRHDCLLDPGRAEQFVQRFRRECKVLGALSHPNIVTMFDAGEDPSSGALFLAMEHVEGLDLQSIIEGGTRFPLAQVIEMALALARALEVAHSHGIVHRDLKPANVLLSITGQVKLTDFGIAKAPGEEITRRGAIVGSPHYLSPEQNLGKEVDGRSDLFSLGVITYQLLTGRRPFGDDGQDVNSNTLSCRPVSIRSLEPSVPRELEDLVLRLLAKRPKDRPARAAEVVRALEELLNAGVHLVELGRPIETPQSPWPSMLAGLLFLALALPTSMLIGNRIGRVRQLAVPPAPAAAPQSTTLSSDPHTPVSPDLLTRSPDRDRTFQQMEQEYQRFLRERTNRGRAGSTPSAPTPK